MNASLPVYAELHCLTNFSFQRGASHPGELVARAHELGYSALAITDECSVAGVVRAYAAWKDLQPDGDHPFKLILGSEFRLRWFCAGGAGPQHGRLGQPLRIHHRGAARSREGRVQRQPRRQRLPVAGGMRNPDRSLPRHARCTWRRSIWKGWSKSFPGLAAASATSTWLAVELSQGLDDALWLQTMQESERNHRRASGGGRQRAHAHSFAQGPAGRHHGGAARKEPSMNAGWNCNRMRSATCARG